MKCESFEHLVDPLVDGELAADELAQARTHAESCAACAARLQQRRDLSRAVRELPRHAAPDVLRARIRALGAGPAAAAMPAKPPSSRLRLGALVVAAAVGLVFAGNAMRQRAQNDATSDQVLASHLRSLLPGRLIDVQSTDQHNVKPWFNGRIALAPDVPNLDSAGFILVGGRVDYIGATPVAVVVYRRRQHVISVFSWPANAKGGHASIERNGYHLIRSERDGVERWIVSDLNRPELEDFSRRYSPP